MVAQDTFHVGTLKGVGRIYQQTVIDTYTRVAFAKLYDRNDRVLPFFEEQEIPVLRILTDRGSEYCGVREHHEYELYLTVEHTRTKAKSPQTNGICECFHKTILEEFYQTAFRRKLYESLEALQADLDQWIESYNNERPHSGRYYNGKTPRQTFQVSLNLAQEKLLDSTLQTV